MGISYAPTHYLCRSATIGEIRVARSTGGRTGDYVANQGGQPYQRTDGGGNANEHIWLRKRLRLSYTGRDFRLYCGRHLVSPAELPQRASDFG
jgi:hypothetical protein